MSNDSNGVINPVDTQLTDAIKDINDRLQNIENTRQPFVSEWFTQNPVDFSYSSNNVLNISNFDAKTVYQIGDKLRLIQSGTTKYFYIKEISANQIEVDAGSDYTYINASITAIAFSKAVAPIGFPSAFNYVPTFQEESTINPPNPLTPTIDFAQYYMVGREITILSHIDGNVADDRSIIYMDYPFSLRTGKSISQSVLPNSGQYGDLNNNLKFITTIRHGTQLDISQFVIDGEFVLTFTGDFLIGGTILKNFDLYINFTYLY